MTAATALARAAFLRSHDSNLILNVSDSTLLPLSPPLCSTPLNTTCRKTKELEDSDGHLARLISAVPSYGEEEDNCRDAYDGDGEALTPKINAGETELVQSKEHHGLQRSDQVADGWIRHECILHGGVSTDKDGHCDETHRIDDETKYFGAHAEDEVSERRGMQFRAVVEPVERWRGARY